MPSDSKKNAAVFLDRDGTIIEDRGHIASCSDIAFFPDTFDALRKLQKHFLLFIITNQPGVAKGIIKRDDVDIINKMVIDRLAKEGIKITDVYVCPHQRSDNCDCIKPKPFFLKKAAKFYNLDMGKSFTIGDHPHDIELGRELGVRGIYVLTGHGKKHMEELPAGAQVAEGIMQAAEKILGCL